MPPASLLSGWLELKSGYLLSTLSLNSSAKGSLLWLPTFREGQNGLWSLLLYTCPPPFSFQNPWVSKSWKHSALPPFLFGFLIWWLPSAAVTGAAGGGARGGGLPASLLGSLLNWIKSFLTSWREPQMKPKRESISRGRWWFDTES